MTLGSNVHLNDNTSMANSYSVNRCQYCGQSLKIDSENKHADEKNIQKANIDLCISSDDEHPANLIPALCRQLYNLGWVTGTGYVHYYNNYHLLLYFYIVLLLFFE